jgi:hypothetical protein
MLSRAGVELSQSTGMRCVTVGNFSGRKDQPVNSKAAPKNKQAVVEKRKTKTKVKGQKVVNRSKWGKVMATSGCFW